MPNDELSNHTRLFRPLLRRADQGCAGAVLMLSLVAISAFWIYQGGLRGGVIEIDRAEPQTVEFQVDINKADWPELMLLPDVGETLARRIVESRESDGPFLDHNDLQRVRGIGPRTVDRMRPYLRPIPPADNMAGH